MMKFLVSFLFLATCTTVLCGNRKRLSVLKDEHGELQVVDDWADGALVTADFNNTINSTGWSFLEIKTISTTADDLELAKAAGMAEGAATAELILMQWKNTLANYCSRPTALCNNITVFLQKNLLYMGESIDKYAQKDPFWYQVQLFLTQLEGLLIGYNSTNLEKLTFGDLFLLQLGGDLDALGGALDSRHHQGSAGGDRVIGAGKCSALVKVLPHNSELFVSHDTWDDYQGMLRTYKLYDFNFATSPSDSSIIPGHRVSFSSYPGVIYSGDDFYQLSSKLVATETTFGNALWKYVTPQAVFEGIRNVVANRLATSGEEWCSYFSMYNSGTYNNQWMVVDYKRFKRGEARLQDGLLWVLEQLPGMIHKEDQTEMLRKTSYWPSFNIP